MIYLKNFDLLSIDLESHILFTKKKSITRMSTSGSLYPFGLFPEKGLKHLEFNSPITIFYGDNGSGKSTILNIISDLLCIGRTSLINKNYWFDEYVNNCSYCGCIPSNSRIITSDDVFNFMLNVRDINYGLDNTREVLKKEFFRLRNDYNLQDAVNDIDVSRPKTFSVFEKSFEAKKKSLNQYIQKRIDNNFKERSNGENAMAYFFEKIEEDALYLLDEPENSLSPEHQLQLVEYIQNAAIGCGCQFIIATHSPFILSLQRSEIYDLDSYPVTKRKWSELKNIQVYRNFFKEHEKDFD